MTTREEYAEAANDYETLARMSKGPRRVRHLLAARVLRQLAEGAVLCHGDSAYLAEGRSLYRPIEEQP
jgi:hypothetical protein